MHAISQCSTPFGINGRITCERGRRHRRPPFVLNAFRHQRTDHRPGSCVCLLVRGAQRLSASTDGSLVGTAFNLLQGQKCSTPFGINGRITPLT